MGRQRLWMQREKRCRECSEIATLSAQPLVDRRHQVLRAKMKETF